VQQELEIFPWLGVAWQDEVASVGGGQVDVDHLHGLEFFEDGAGRESGGFGSGALLEGDLQAVAEETDKDV